MFNDILIPLLCGVWPHGSKFAGIAEKEPKLWPKRGYHSNRALSRGFSQPESSVLRDLSLLECSRVILRTYHYVYFFVYLRVTKIVFYNFVQRDHARIRARTDAISHKPSANLLGPVSLSWTGAARERRFLPSLDAKLHIYFAPKAIGAAQSSWKEQTFPARLLEFSRAF